MEDYSMTNEKLNLEKQKRKFSICLVLITVTVFISICVCIELFIYILYSFIKICYLSHLAVNLFLEMSI